MLYIRYNRCQKCKSNKLKKDENSYAAGIKNITTFMINWTSNWLTSNFVLNNIFEYLNSSSEMGYTGPLLVSRNKFLKFTKILLVFDWIFSLVFNFKWWTFFFEIQRTFLNFKCKFRISNKIFECQLKFWELRLKNFIVHFGNNKL